MLLAFARDIAARVVDELGEDTADSIFLAGSAAKGEVAHCQIAGVTEIYSDVDVYVVVNERADLGACRDKLRGLAGDVAREGDGYRIVPPPDIGVFNRFDLAAQKNRPGTADIRTHHTMLYGDESVPLTVSGFDPSSIPGEEALYLIENRLVELYAKDDIGGDHADETDERYAVYVALKGCADAVTATLITLGRYVPFLAARMNAFFDASLRDEVLSVLDGETVEQMRGFWLMLCAPETTMSSVARFDAIRSDAKDLIARTWRCIAGRIAELEDNNWPWLLDWRCRGRRSDHRRELWLLQRRLGASRWGLFRHGARLTYWSPTALVRLGGLLQSKMEREPDPAIDVTFLPVMDCLTHCFGFRDGSLYRRGREMYRAVMK